MKLRGVRVGFPISGFVDRKTPAKSSHPIGKCVGLDVYLALPVRENRARTSVEAGVLRQSWWGQQVSGSSEY